MTKLIGFALIVVATSTALTASAVPEIDGGTAGSALALIAGVLLVMRGRRSK